MAAMPTPDLAVPYEAPRQVKTMAAVQPMAPKKGCCHVSTKPRFYGYICVAGPIRLNRLGGTEVDRHRQQIGGSQV